MGHRSSRLCKRQDASNPQGPLQENSSSSSNTTTTRLSPSVQVSHPFRCEDRSDIPDELLQGPFEDFEITEDVYATFYLLARNATPDMYSISPFKNPDVRIAWLYLLFIVGSQLFVIALITVVYPPSAQRESAHVDCGNVTSVSALHARGFFSSADETSCLASAVAGFEADVRGRTVTISIVEQVTPFHDAVFLAGGPLVLVLRGICSTWVFAQIYFQEFSSVKALLSYHDFSQWFLPLKQQTVHNGWAVMIPLIQYAVLLVVATVSFLVICAFDEPFDIVMNSLAFTFIAEVSSFFNEPLVKRMAETNIKGYEIQNGDPVKYLYPDYRRSNAINDDGTYTDAGWYILDDEEKAGLLSDYKVRHNEGAYPRPQQRTVRVLEALIFLAPVAAVLCAALRSGALGRPLALRREL